MNLTEYAVICYVKLILTQGSHKLNTETYFPLALFNNYYIIKEKIGKGI